MQETRVRSLGQEDPPEKEMATHFSIPAWRIPWTEEPGGLQSMGSKRVGHDWATNTNTLENKNKDNFRQKENTTHMGSSSSHSTEEALNSPFIQFPEDGDVIRMDCWVNFQEIQNMMWDYSTFLY